MSRANEPTEYLEHTGQPTDRPQPIATRVHGPKCIATATRDKSGNATTDRLPEGGQPEYGEGMDADSDL